MNGYHNCYRACNLLLQSAAGSIESRNKNKDGDEVFNAGQTEMIEDMRRYCESHGLPVMVVHIPSRKELLNHSNAAKMPLETERFAVAMDARLIDGSLAFCDLSADEIRGDWLRYDGHWGQGGSDRFARYLARLLLSTD